MSKLPHRVFPGCTYFVTTSTWERRELFRVPEVAEILVRRILVCRGNGAYQLHEFVVMPNHFHLLMTPGATITLEKAAQLIKGGSSHEIHAQRGHRMHLLRRRLWWANSALVSENSSVACTKVQPQP